MISNKTLLLAPLWGIAVVWTCIMGDTVGPDLEQELFPVITEHRVFDLSRPPGRACWEWTYTKNRTVTLVKELFYIERDDGIRFPTSEFRPDLGIPSNDSTTAKGGDTRTIPKCVFVPVAMEGQRHFVVRGFNYYRSPTRLWDLVQVLEPIEFDRSELVDPPPHDTAPPASLALPIPH